MTKIKVGDKFAIIDDKDFDRVNQFSWGFHYTHKGTKDVGYTSRVEHRTKRVYLHRFIMEMYQDIEGKMLDHINGNKLDNRRENLRIVNNSQNMLNRGKTRKNTSGYKGIHWDKDRSKWMVQLRVDNKHIHLGRYSTIQGAWLARRWGERTYFNI